MNKLIVTTAAATAAALAFVSTPLASASDTGMAGTQFSPYVLSQAGAGGMGAGAASAQADGGVGSAQAGSAQAGTGQAGSAPAEGAPSLGAGQGSPSTGPSLGGNTAAGSTAPGQVTAEQRTVEDQRRLSDAPREPMTTESNRQAASPPDQRWPGPIESQAEFRERARVSGEEMGPGDPGELAHDQTSGSFEFYQDPQEWVADTISPAVGRYSGEEAYGTGAGTSSMDR